MDVFINVTGQKLKIASNLKDYVDGSQDFIRFVFNFNDDTWSDMLVTAQFQQNGKAYDVVLDKNNSAFLPPEIHIGRCCLILFGNKTNVRTTTSNVFFDISSNFFIQNALSVTNLPKTWVALGDSKTDFNNNGVSRPDNYPYWIVKRNPEITLKNLGSAGGMITNERVNKPGDTKILYPSIYTKATQITGTPDIITVAGGYNDWNWAVTLGTFTTDISGYDTSAAANVPSSGAAFPLKNTFYMGVFRLAKYLTERFPTTPILWITPFPTTSKNNGGANGWNVCLPLSDYVQAIKDVCAYFSIPVCDMYTAGGLTPFTSSNLSTYWRNSDGVHPNGDGSEIYSHKIERMMKQVYNDRGKIW